jgi:cytochrome c-type biogenesis protein CcmH
MLGRSYAAMGRGKEAIDAYKKVVALKPKDAQALADLADGLATANNRNLDGEPEKLITQALAIDPTNVKALALAGTVAFNKSDFKAAVGLWERAVAKAEAGSEFAKQLQQAANEARTRAGMPVTAMVETPAPAAAAAPAAAPAAAGKEAITGRVTLADSLKGKVGPDDTLFIFARPATGPKMPLAILRKRVGDLPVDFQLDDTQAMSPATRLSGAAKVVVGARISKAGQATSQPGDLQGFSAEVSVGTQGLKIEINDTVR